MNYLLLITALSLSGVAAWYAITGLTAIFAAAVIPIIIMGSLLEVSKLVVASWLYRNWKEIPVLMRSYFTTALVVLMLLTSMGIFGFLSKAHMDQTMVSGDNTLQIEMLDNKIAREQARIKDADTVLAQLDKSVQVLIDYDRIRGKDGAIAVRESQKEERAQLASIVTDASDIITKLQQEKLVLDKQRIQQEAEVGPIKYIAALIYGDNASNSMLEEAVRIVILMIVGVFDPLAVLMVIAANWGFKSSESTKEQPHPTVLPQVDREVYMEELDERPWASPPITPKKPEKREWLDPLPNSLELFFKDDVVIEDVFDPEQRGWPNINKWKNSNNKKS